MNILFPFIPAQEAAVSADDSIDKVVDVLHAAGTTEEKTAAVAALNDIAKSGRQEVRRARGGGGVSRDV